MTNLQRPIGSGFGAASTTRDVIQGISLSGKTVIVTGGYSGLGREAVKTFVTAGAEVIVPARDLERASKALEGIERVTIEKMDLLDPASIDAFADRFLAMKHPLHLLVNSAAIMACPLARDARGYESQFSTNHLGHFQLTTRLLPALREAHGARVVSVSSLGHRYSPVFFDDPNYEHRAYTPWLGYGQSKTANILFALALDEREKANGIRAFSLHPGGIVNTSLGKYIPKEMLREAGVIDPDGNPVLDPSQQLKTVEQGAATIVWCATSPKLNGLGGVYCENCDVAGIMKEPIGRTTMADARRLTGVMPYAIDPDSANSLWELSKKLLAGPDIG